MWIWGKYNKLLYNLKIITMPNLPKPCQDCNRNKVFKAHTHHIILAYVYAAAAIILVFCGFYVEPLGIIASSVITAAGIFSGFAAAYMGLKDFSIKLMDYIGGSGRQKSEE